MNKKPRITLVQMSTDSDWVLSWFARILAKGLNEVADIAFSDAPQADADLNYRLIWWKLPGWEKTKLDVAHFTHFNRGYDFDVDEALALPDHLVTIGQASKNLLTARGIAPSKISVICPGNDGFVPTEEKAIRAEGRIIIGLTGRPYHNGRKREWLLAELAWRTNLDRFAFVFLGPGWETVVRNLKFMGVACEHFPNLDYSDYPKVIASLDAYLCTAFVEAGPMGALQAMGCGVPVISPHYGFAQDFGAIYYETAEDLIAVLENFEPTKRRPLRTTWDDYVRAHWKLFKGLLGCNSS